MVGGILMELLDFYPIEKIKHTINESLRYINFDLMKIFIHNRNSNELLEIQSSYIKSTDFISNLLESDMKPNIRSLETNFKIIFNSKKTLILDNKTKVNNSSGFGKAFSGSYYEIYIPLFEGEKFSKEVYGFICMVAFKESDFRIQFNNEDFQKLIMQIINYSYKNKDKYTNDIYGFLNILLYMSEINEPYMLSHPYNVAHLCLTIGEKLGLSKDELKRLQIAALLHNIGRIYLDPNIRDKKWDATKEEEEILKNKVNYSYNIALQVDKFLRVEGFPEIILYHNERIDGKGYPYGKMDKEIPIGSKILSIADYIDSMMTNTYIRKRKSVEEIIEELYDSGGTRFDNSIVQVAVNVLLEESADYDKLLMGSGIYCNLTIAIEDNESHKKSSITSFGNIRKDGETYIFTNTEKYLNRVLDKSLITKLTIYIQLNNIMMKFRPTLKNISDDEITFSNLELIKENDTFSLRWLIDGKFITTNKKEYEIYINLIGGEFIDFYLYKKDIDEEIKVGIIFIDYEDGEKIKIPGCIINSYSMEDKIFFRFKYVGINSNTKDIIFKEMFKKQIEMRTMYSKFSNRVIKNL